MSSSDQRNELVAPNWAVVVGPFLAALFGHGAMSDLSSECGPNRTSFDRSEFGGSRPSEVSRPT